MARATRSNPQHSAETALHEAATRVQDAIEPLRTKLSDAYSMAQDKSGEAVESAERYIKQSPFRSVAYTAAIAVLIGVVATALFARRRERPTQDPTRYQG